MSSEQKRSRRDCRIAAMKMLYEYDVNHNAPEEIYSYHLNLETYSEVSKPYIQELFFETLSNLEEIDSIITRHLINWDLERLSPIERNLLRMGVYEMLFLQPPAPREVVINEAVEMAKEYANHQSSRLINGVLDHIKSRNLETDSDTDQ